MSDDRRVILAGEMPVGPGAKAIHVFGDAPPREVQVFPSPDAYLRAQRDDLRNQLSLALVKSKGRWNGAATRARQMLVAFDNQNPELRFR